MAATEVDAVKATAQVETDGALRVTEQRTFLFDSEYSMLMLPMSSMQKDSELKVLSIRFAHTTVQGGIDGDWTSLEECSFSPDMRDAFEQTDGIAAKVSALEAKAEETDDPASLAVIPQEGSFAVDTRENAVYLFFAPISGRVMFDLDFTITNDVRAFDDVAELYWDYFPSEEMPASSVNVTVRLPMPEGMEAVAGQNVHAWGHGAAGSVDVKADGTVVYRVPEVRTGQYAQAHVLFPVSWVSNLPIKARQAYTGTRLDDAKAEEAAWTDTWSAWLSNSLWLDLVFVGIGIVAIAGSVALSFIYGREEKRADGKTASVSVLERYEAPLVGRLLRWDHESPKDFVACLMQLSMRGALQIEVEADSGVIASPLGRGYEEMRIKAGAHAKDLITSHTDQELFRLLFDQWGEGYMSVTLSDIQRSAKTNRIQFRQDMHDWSLALSREVQEADFFDRRSMRMQKVIMIVGCILCASTLVFGVLGGSFVRGTALMLAGIVCLVLGNYTVRRTAEGVTVATSARALKDCDFEGESIDSDDLVPYLFEVQYQSDSVYDPQEVMKNPMRFWLDRRRGRGGKPSPSFANQLALKLDEWG